MAKKIGVAVILNGSEIDRLSWSDFMAIDAVSGMLCEDINRVFNYKGIVL